MSTNPQTQAIQVANALISAAQQLMGLFNTMSTLDAQWTDQSTATILANMQTALVNADGSLAAADATPTAGHALTAVTLSRAISANQITQIKTILDAVVTLVNGSAVSAQTGARAILNVAVGG
jgi:hypothetical protein